MKNKNESGYMLIGALLAITVLSIFGLTLTALSLNSVKTSSAERDNQSAYYIAEAGLNYLANEFEQAVNEIYEQEDVQTEEEFYYEVNQLIESNALSSIYDNFEENDQFQPYASMNIVTDPSNKARYKLSSLGKIKEEERHLTQVIEVQWQKKYLENSSVPYELPPLAVYTSGMMNLSNGSIEGSIGTTSKEKHAIKATSGVRKVTDEIFVPVIEESEDNRTCKESPTNEYKSYSISRPTWEATVPCPKEMENMWHAPELPPFPEIPTDYSVMEDRYISTFKVIDNGNLRITNEKANNYELKLDRNVKFDEIALNGNRNLVIDVGNQDRFIIVNHLNMANGNIILKGEGTLTLYVVGRVTIEAGSTINNHEKGMSAEVIERLNIFYSGYENFQMSGSQFIYGSLYSKNADIYITGSGRIYGNIFSGGESITFTGGSESFSQLILAPKATFTLAAGGNIHGIIISKEFNHTSGQKVIYSEPFDIDGPISPSALTNSNNNEDNNNDESNDNELIETDLHPIIDKMKILEVEKN